MRYIILLSYLDGYEGMKRTGVAKVEVLGVQ